MGRSKRHFKGNNRHKDNAYRKEKEAKWKSTRGDDPNNNNTDTAYHKATFENARFELFYKAQKFVSDNEWDEFMSSLRSPLPACFRLNSDYIFLNELRKQLNQFVGEKQMITSKSSGQNIELHPVKQLEWYPNNVGYQMGTDRRSIRKTPELESLHKWMVIHTDNGNITRQEAVSMVPPLALNVQPHHKCKLFIIFIHVVVLIIFIFHSLFSCHCF